MSQETIVKQASSALKAGNYQAACELFKKAAERYGQKLFEVNIRHCQRKLAEIGELPGGAVPQAAMSVSKQLRQTQQLLEHYVKRCQELEYRILDS